MSGLPEREPPEVELTGRAWVRSTLCATADCVEVSAGGGEVAVRDSKERHGPLLHFDRVARSEFLADARNGELDRP
jgi:hypothetical protein